MNYSTTETYKMKREILSFSKGFSGSLSAPDRKFTADMTYGIVVSQSCLLTRIAQQLQENTKKIYTVDRLSDHLAKGIPGDSMAAYLRFVRKMTPKEPVIYIRPLAKLSRAVKVADSSDQGKAKSKTISAVAVALR